MLSTKVCDLPTFGSCEHSFIHVAYPCHFDHPLSFLWSSWLLYLAPLSSPSPSPHIVQGLVYSALFQKFLPLAMLSHIATVAFSSTIPRGSHAPFLLFLFSITYYLPCLLITYFTCSSLNGFLLFRTQMPFHWDIYLDNSFPFSSPLCHSTANRLNEKPHINLTSHYPAINPQKGQVLYWSNYYADLSLGSA